MQHKTGKRAQKLIAECKKLGFAEELSKPKPYELKMMLIERAKAQDTTLPEGAAAALLERCGEDPFLLENEVDKLCALSGYQTVTAAMVAEMGTVSLEADVFEMIRMITGSSWVLPNGRATPPCSRILATRAATTGSSAQPKRRRTIRWGRSKPACRCCWTSIKV